MDVVCARYPERARLAQLVIDVWRRYLGSVRVTLLRVVVWDLLLLLKPSQLYSE